MFEANDASMVQIEHLVEFGRGEPGGRGDEWSTDARAANVSLGAFSTMDDEARRRGEGREDETRRRKDAPALFDARAFEGARGADERHARRRVTLTDCVSVSRYKGALRGRVGQ